MGTEGAILKKTTVSTIKEEILPLWWIIILYTASLTIPLANMKNPIT